MTQRENNGRKLTMKEIFEALSRASKGDNDARQHLQHDLLAALERVVPLVVRSRPTTAVLYGARVHVSTGSMRFNSPWYVANAARWYVQSATP